MSKFYLNFCLVKIFRYSYKRDLLISFLSPILLAKTEDRKVPTKQEAPMMKVLTKTVGLMALFVHESSSIEME